MKSEIGHLTANDCFRELSLEKSQKYIHMFRSVFSFVSAHAGQDYSQIRRLHLGYTAMREPAFDFISAEFPWLEDFRRSMSLEKKINFLETNGVEKKEFLPHVDGKNNAPIAMFNVPILNCTSETKTYWVEPIADFKPVLLCENGTKGDTKLGATPHLPSDVPFRVVAEHSFTDRCVLFRSNVFHGVKNNSMSSSPRIMMHWWFSDGIDWKKAIEILDRNQWF